MIVISNSRPIRIRLSSRPFCSRGNNALHGFIVWDMCVPLDAYFWISASTFMISISQSRRKARFFLDNNIIDEIVNRICRRIKNFIYGCPVYSKPFGLPVG